MNKYAIISTSHYDNNEWKNFHVLLENLTREQILGLQSAIPLFMEECKTKHPVNIYLNIEDYGGAIRGDHFQDLMFGNIIQMCTLETFI